MPKKRIAPKRRKVFAVDLFCGAGGTSTGIIRACEEMNLEVELLAVNHWTTAIETHSANHPEARHVCARIDHVIPEEAVPTGRLHLLVASPECTHHSKARGGKPMNDQSRATAWDVLNWASRLYVDNILIENVPEFRDWGPLGANGRPLISKKGESFRAFIETLERYGYKVEWRILDSADYGDATNRKRFFLQARRGNKKITWPEPTHAPREKVATLFGDKKPWRSAREIIDWSIVGQSIFDRKKPLAQNTLARIEEGILKFWGEYAQAFIVVLRQHMGAVSLDEPLPTITASGTHIALVQPMVLGQQSGSIARGVDKPLPTISTDGAISLIEPLVITVARQLTNRSVVRSVDEPLPTITGTQRIGMLSAFLVPQYGERDGQRPRVHSIDEPLPSVTSHGAGAIVSPFIVPQHTASDARSVEDPLQTITTTSRGIGLCQPYLVEFYGNGGARSIDDPVPTITTKDRFGLVMIGGTLCKLDILFRMLQPTELAAATGFPKGYIFKGNKSDTVKQIGNAVTGELAKRLVTEPLREFLPA